MADQNRIKTQYKQRLPHIQPIGQTFFVTFRLYGSIPKVKMTELENHYHEKFDTAKKIGNPLERNTKLFTLRKQYFAEHDQLLDKILSGPDHFKKDNIAQAVADELHRFDGKFYDLVAYCIMSNHVHILIDTMIQSEHIQDEEELNQKYTNLDQIMKRIKGPTAVRCNKLLNIQGQFWDRESFDMYIRNEKMLNNVIAYILNNPVKSGIVNNWEEYKWNYYKYNS